MIKLLPKTTPFGPFLRFLDLSPFLKTTNDGASTYLCPPQSRHIRWVIPRPWLSWGDEDSVSPPDPHTMTTSCCCDSALVMLHGLVQPLELACTSDVIKGARHWTAKRMLIGWIDAVYKWRKRQTHLQSQTFDVDWLDIRCLLYGHQSQRARCIMGKVSLRFESMNYGERQNMHVQD